MNPVSRAGRRFFVGVGSAHHPDSSSKTVGGARTYGTPMTTTALDSHLAHRPQSVDRLAPDRDPLPPRRPGPSPDSSPAPDRRRPPGRRRPGAANDPPRLDRWRHAIALPDAEGWAEAIRDEVGKPLDEAMGEVVASLDAIEWTARHGWKALADEQRLGPGWQSLLLVPSGTVCVGDRSGWSGRDDRDVELPAPSERTDDRPGRLRGEWCGLEAVRSWRRVWDEKIEESLTAIPAYLRAGRDGTLLEKAGRSARRLRGVGDRQRGVHRRVRKRPPRAR